MRTAGQVARALRARAGAESASGLQPPARGAHGPPFKDESAFRSVHSWHGTVQWAGGQDICPDTLYEDSVPVHTLESLMVRKPAAKYTTKHRRDTKPNRKSTSKV
ncbi:MAG: hypothetical protein WCR06_01190 [bacterium]